MAPALHVFVRSQASLSSGGHRRAGSATAAATRDAGGASLARLGLIDGEAAAFVLMIIETVDSRTGFGLHCTHLDKAKTLAAAGVAIGDDL